MSKPEVVEIDGKHLSLTNLDKVLYPAAGFTKGQVIDYYARIAPVLLPHLAGHPLTLKRYPGGVDKEFFFEKNATKHRPDWVKTAPIWSEGNQRNVNYILANDLPTLVWIANLAAIELHPSLSLAKDIVFAAQYGLRSRSRPSREYCAVLPGGNVAAGDFRALRIAELSQDFRLKGPADLCSLELAHQLRGHQGFRSRARAFARERAPGIVVSDMKKQLRVGKVFVDWSQNDEHKTTISVYSLRAREHPTVSTPVKWDEVEQALKKKDATLLVFEAGQVLDRVQKMGDLFEPVLTLKQKLPKLAGIAEAAPGRPNRDWTWRPRQKIPAPRKRKRKT